MVHTCAHRKKGYAAILLMILLGTPSSSLYKHAKKFRSTQHNHLRILCHSSMKHLFGITDLSFLEWSAGKHMYQLPTHCPIKDNTHFISWNQYTNPSYWKTCYCWKPNWFILTRRFAICRNNTTQEKKRSSRKSCSSLWQLLINFLNPTLGCLNTLLNSLPLWDALPKQNSLVCMLSNTDQNCNLLPFRLYGTLKETSQLGLLSSFSWCIKFPPHLSINQVCLNK